MATAVASVLIHTIGTGTTVAGSRLDFPSLIVKRYIILEQRSPAGDWIFLLVLEQPSPAPGWISFSGIQL